MSYKAQLRQQRYNTVINRKSKKQELNLGESLFKVIETLQSDGEVVIHHEGSIALNKIINKLEEMYSDVQFARALKTSSMRPDGGILYVVDNKDNLYPILIAEVKNQGTNDLRAREGKPKQARGNAIERLGKNVIGFRTFLLNESIFPFVVFGYGCDFEDGSSILDRVATINMFGQLNVTNLHNLGPNGIFNRGSFYFREQKWTEEEMFNIMLDIATRSIHYYYSKYGKTIFE